MNRYAFLKWKIKRCEKQKEPLFIKNLKRLVNLVNPNKQTNNTKEQNDDNQSRSIIFFYLKSSFLLNSTKKLNRIFMANKIGGYALQLIIT